MNFYCFANVVMRLLVRLIARGKVEGLENVPLDGSFILVANHISWLDPPLLGSLLPRDVRFMAKEELFRKPFVGWVVKNYRAFPVRRGEGDKQALRTALDILRTGGVLGMFPEGTRSKNGGLQQGHSGAALLAVKAGAPVLPIAITGTQYVCRFPDMLRRPAFKVKIGQPFNVNLPAGKGSGARLTIAVEEMMVRIADLLPPEHRGVYSAEGHGSKVS